MIKTDLCGEWELSFTHPITEQKIDTRIAVPSNIEPTLVNLGLLDDYMPSDNPYVTQAFEAVDDWTYVKRFDAPEKKEGYTEQLVFEGIDTVAEIYLNGEKLLDCENMHVAYKADVTGKLLPIGNELKVVIRSSELYARRHLHDMHCNGRDGMTNYDSYSHLRKARHQWGWDNAPRLITSGIIRSVYVEQLPPCRFEEVYLFTENVTDEYVYLGASWIYQTPKKLFTDHALRLTLLDGERVIHEQCFPAFFVQGLCRYVLPRKDVELWWPTGFGSPRLYTVKLEMLDRGEVAASFEAPFGIRTIRLDWTEDIDPETGGEFVFLVNGIRTYIRGTNWKPLDPLASLADAKLKEGNALEEIRALNCNM
ncbi:MAG: hypothetical protein IJW16_04970, partial [Clostridia bacterium]|nr:hypothetical protein [Clostridia bacterium]